MTISSTGIDNVRAYELSCGIKEDGDSFASPRSAMVKWSSTASDKFFQVYVNGSFAGVTLDANQRQIVVRLPSSFETAVTIHVFAVDADEIYTDFSDDIEDATATSGRVNLSLLKSQSLPLDSVANIYFDNKTGQIDYENPLNEFPIPVWPSWQDKAGFAMSEFGESDFGFDAAAAIGFGRGCLGENEFGIDAGTFDWVSGQLTAGVYEFAVKITDKNGNESIATLTGQITVIPDATPAEDLSVLSFDKVTNQLVLEIE